MLAKKTVILCLGLAIGGFSHNALRGQSGPAVDEGLYTADQAQRGNTSYQKQCASCHGSDLSGAGPFPPLIGDEFLSKYEGQPMLTLFNMIQKLMPVTNPGSLARPDTADILSFVLSSNKFPAGKTELPSDEESLKKLQLPKPAPKS